jgi:hypothetical protein
VRVTCDFKGRGSTDSLYTFLGPAVRLQGTASFDYAEVSMTLNFARVVIMPSGNVGFALRGMLSKNQGIGTPRIWIVLRKFKLMLGNNISVPVKDNEPD